MPKKFPDNYKNTIITSQYIPATHPLCGTNVN